MKSMKLNLQAKYGIAILSLVLFVIVVLTTVVAIQGKSAIKHMTYMSSQTLEADLLDQLKKRAELLARFLADQLSEPLRKKRRGEDLSGH